MKGVFIMFYTTSNQTRTDKIYLEGRGYTDLTILVFNIIISLSFKRVFLVIVPGLRTALYKVVFIEGLALY